MSYIFKTIIVPASHVELARAVCASAGSGGEGMFIVKCAPVNNPEDIHYISSGLIGSAFESAFSSTGIIVTMAEEANVEVTLEQIEELMSVADISDEGLGALTRLGMKIISD